MKKVVIFFFLAVLTTFAPVASTVEPLTVAVAANMQSAMDEITAAFTKETGVPVRTSVGSSGKLTAQIKAGAPFHLFVSADMDYPQKLHADGYAKQPPAAYAYGTLVLWSMTGADISGGLDSLESDKIGKIAISNPETAPYGAAAVAALRKAGIYEMVKGKLVYAESISQTNQFIASGAVQAGLTAKSEVTSAEMAGKGKWVEIDGGLHPRITQGVVILKYGADHNQEGAKRLYDYILSSKGGDILRRHGYKTP